MSWASRRRGIYLLGIISFLIIVIGIPIAKYIYQTPTCTDGKQNQGETAPDKGGPCPILDERALSPASILWSRSFSVRDGSYSSVAYVVNENANAGVRQVSYRFGLYDESNVPVAERVGKMFVMPLSITPAYEMKIDTGNRKVSHTYFEFTEPLIWERLKSGAAVISISNKEITDIGSSPRLEAIAENVSIAPVLDLSFVTVIFDSTGNARATSMTSLARLDAGEKQKIVFTWPNPFTSSVGRIDIFPLVRPSSLK
ncbi:hypothetical protein A3C86_03845 [Candidatus Kaiserbacteria bacterium RIFCSPHIGHO2_02_FULL_49_16]|uniref:Uncharacterized protein n=1 Tax=Candidatus Kaiserbacteria bacterium RIFCSPHIGHO2_02_FULL_49_16 TaxID=1798490 RepID=A0A1F6DA98_9BACT|nr:MAG: hypothetical protein A3C86_03845 [Candidatus Kaiserbacteria bacterium RIFCSPHIGHO2_02_FULL_49_16]